MGAPRLSRTLMLVVNSSIQSNFSSNTFVQLNKDVKQSLKSSNLAPNPLHKKHEPIGGGNSPLTPKKINPKCN